MKKERRICDGAIPKKEGEMKRVFAISVLIFAVVLAPFVSGHAQSRAVDRSAVPLPPDLANLPTIMAEPWLQVDPRPNVILEGPSFDRQGNLFVTAIPNPGRVLKITPQKQVSVIFESKDIDPNGTAFHKDGRLFVACLTGQLLAMNQDGSNVVAVKPTYQGRPLKMNDLVFDAKGNIFISDWVGNVSDPAGGVYYVSPDGSMVKAVLQNLWAANGVSLSPGGMTLWVSETGRGTVIRVDFLPDGVTPIPSRGVGYAYYSSGRSGPDSNKVDAKGNLYQAIMGQGRLIIFNNRGIPIANVLIPGRDQGENLSTSNLAFKPGTKEAYITVGGQGGAWIFKFDALEPGVTLFSHQP